MLDLINKKRELRINRGTPFTISTFAVYFFSSATQVFWLSDRPTLHTFPFRSGGTVALSGFRPRLQRRDRHGLAPCSAIRGKHINHFYYVKPF